MIRRELDSRHWYGVNMRGGRRHRHFILDGMTCIVEHYSEEKSEDPLLGSHIPCSPQSEVEVSVLTNLLQSPHRDCPNGA